MNTVYNVVFTDPPYADYQYYSDLSLFSLSITKEIDNTYLEHLLNNEIVLRDKKHREIYFQKLYDVFKQIKNLLSDNGKLMITYHHHDPEVVLDFMKIFKSLGFNLDAIYPVFGESSGRLIRRKLYLDLLFVFSKKESNTYFVPTNIYITENDKKLMELAMKIARGLY